MTPPMCAITMLPNVPNEVFDNFIFPFIDDMGWPFSNILDRTEGTSWWVLLGGLSLKDFSKLRWKRSQFLWIIDDIFHPESNRDINFLIDYHIKGNKTSPVRNIPQSKERLLWHMAYIEGTRRFCTPIITIVTHGSYLRILDGMHRIAALLSLGLKKEVPIDAWIGE